ncbi:hypothetical protein ISP17_13455 [Dyella ginsengisoli]|uniref:Integrase n=1 Tax=Dyella ginsengisoli TaxID=363848 RepID=A0ABW8JV44_9GAMM
MPRKRLDWTWDDEKQEFTTPAGNRISLAEIAGMVQGRAECRHDFEGDWAGWRMRGRQMIPPRATKNGPRMTPENLAAFVRWASPFAACPGLRVASVIDLAPRIADELRPALTLDGLARRGRSGATPENGNRERHERHDGHAVRQQMIHGNPLP